MDDKVREFLEKHHDAVMSTTKKDGMPHLARVTVGLLDGKLQSSGTRTRVRTQHLRRDPRCALMVMNEDTLYQWMVLECAVTIHDGPDAPERNLALYRALAGEPENLDEYMEAMVKDQRLIYEFEIKKTYGMY